LGEIRRRGIPGLTVAPNAMVRGIPEGRGGQEKGVNRVPSPSRASSTPPCPSTEGGGCLGLSHVTKGVLAQGRSVRKGGGKGKKGGKKGTPPVPKLPPCPNNEGGAWGFHMSAHRGGHPHFPFIFSRLRKHRGGCLGLRAHMSQTGHKGHKED